MELVYLWVEEYKNIKKQGFNFSPRFACHYDEDSNELTIDEKKDYVDVFPKNINVTAIVGENGSGKSSIQKLIFLLIFLKKYQEMDISKSENSQKEDAIVDIFQNKKFKDKNIFLIINTTQGLRKISLLASIDEYQQEAIKKFKISTKKCCLQGKYQELNPKEIDFFSIHFHYMIDTWYDDFYDKWTNSIYHRVDKYDTPLLLEPYKGHEEDNSYIDISNIEYLNNNKMFNLYANIKDNKQINSFFNPQKIWMMIDSNKILKKYEDFVNEYGIDDPRKKVFIDFIYEKVNNKELIVLNKMYLAIKITTSRKEIFNDESIIQELRDKLLNAKEKDEFEKFFDELPINEILKKKGLPETQKIEACIDFHEHFHDDKTKEEKYENFLVSKVNEQKDEFPEINTVFKEFAQIVPWIYIEFYDNDKSYNSLSSGEKLFLNFSINVMYQVRNIESLEKQQYKTINLFLDEVELGLHPNWQKRFIQEVFYMLKNFKSQFNIIYATHSPFILSDLPKENVIFLKDGKQIEVDIDTFGANIHTLLSHGFFMENGLMGEFAKSKIDKAIKYLNQKTLSDKEIDYCENIISIIGEPILKRQLQKMLDSKRLYKVDDINKKIKDMEYELSVLKKYQKKATHNELNDKAKKKYSKNKSDEDE
jgi:ABC-type dipeptide/oligopeptide/nickel transport system ATPase component